MLHKRTINTANIKRSRVEYMFGKEQPHITDEESVGEYIEELKRQGTTELNNFILEEEDEMVGTSTDTSCKREDND